MHCLKPLPAFICALASQVLQAQPTTNAATTAVTREVVEQVEKIFGLNFSSEKNEMLVPGLKQQLRLYETIRKFPLSNSVPSAMLFNPIPVGRKFETARKSFKLPPVKARLPENPEELAFYSVEQLGALIKSRQITSEKLTRLYLERLKKQDPTLHCVVTLTQDLALEQARRADQEIARGKYRGPLHGIPYGAKDLLATKGIRTTWGSAPYTNQVFSEDSTVIKRLEEAGAVLVAKLTLGELAMGDVWFGGKTRNPWNTEHGSSGSSAGSAAAVAAG